MYEDHQPCQVCGAPVRVTPHSPEQAVTGPVGPAGGVVGSGDPTLDDRTCTNDACPTREATPGAPPP